MHAHSLHFLFAFGSDVDENVFKCWGFFFGRIANVDGGPAKYAFHNPFIRMNIHPHGRSNLMIGTPIASYINISFIGDVIHKPTDLIGMCFYYYLVLCLWIDHSYHRSIDIHDMLIDVWTNVGQPDLLARKFEAGGGCIIEVIEKKLFPFFFHVWFS